MTRPAAPRGAILTAGLALLLSACTHIGPGTIPGDRVEYVQALRESWKRQVLLNVVALRYAEAPMFFEVASVINQYSLETNVDGRLAWTPGNPGSPAVGAYGRYSDRPTITYTPVTGERYVRSMLTPIPPTAILSLVQSGWPVDFVLRLTVRSINGVATPTSSTLLGTSRESERTLKLLSALRRIQLSGVIGLRIEKREGASAVMVIFAEDSSAERAEDLRYVQETLGLAKDRREYRLVSGSAPEGDDVIAVLTRSMIDIMLELSAAVDVPPEDLAAGRVSARRVDGPTDPRGAEDAAARIRWSDDDPQDVFVKVRYRDRWFYVEDTDMRSKTTLSFLLLLLSLSESGGGQGVPLVTVGAGG